jgi:hypothetical protein
MSMRVNRQARLAFLAMVIGARQAKAEALGAIANLLEGVAVVLVFDVALIAAVLWFKRPWLGA